MMPIRLFAKQGVHSYKLQTFLSKRLKSTHVYRQVIPWKHAKDLADDIVKTVFFNEYGLIALSKPYGVGSSSSPGAKQYSNAAPVGDRVFSMYETLPYLAKHLGHTELFLASVPERYTSGVTILTTSKNLKDKVKSCLQFSNMTNDTMKLYVAVVLGSPSGSSGTKTVGVKMSSIIQNQPLVVPLSNTGLKARKMRRLTVSYDQLSSSPSTSLLSLRAYTAAYNALRVFCTDVLVSPILGDNMFGSRVKSILGKPVLVNLTNQVARKPQKLKKDILEALELTPGLELIVPNHLHLQEVHLPNYRNRNVILRTPPPSVFQWSCQKLGLEIPECGPCEAPIRKEKLKTADPGKHDTMELEASS